MVLPAGWSQDSRVQYDCAISWIGEDSSENTIPFLWAKSGKFPYTRTSAELSERQIASAAVSGEQSLDGWWYRSQSSWHGGQGFEWLNILEDPNLSTTFETSCGVEVFNSEGQASLIRESNLQESAGGVSYCVPYMYGGADGVLWATGNALYTVNSAGTKTAVSWGGTGTILALITDGSRYYVADTDGIYAGAANGGAGAKLWSWSSVSNVALGYAKERLFVGVSTGGYGWMMTLTVSPAGAPAAVVFTEGKDSSEHSGNAGQGRTWKHPSLGWVWSGVADGPGAVYMSGYVGDQSSVYAVSIADEAGSPVVQIPSEIAQTPRMELVRTILSYMGSFLMLGTTRGIRVCSIESDASIRVGPLSEGTPNAVTAIVAYGEVVLYSGAVASHLSPTLVQSDAVCVTKLDLSRPVLNKWGNQTGKYATAKYVYSVDGSGSSSAVIPSVCMIGDTGRLAFTVSGEGLYFEHPTESVTNGWMRTGKIKMDTWESKLFAYLKVTNSVVDGDMAVWYRTDRNGSWVKLYEWDTDTIQQVSMDGSDGKTPVDWIQYLFVLGRGDTVSNTPILTGWQVKSQPSEVQQIEMQLPLLCHYRERTRTGMSVVRSTWERITELESAQRKAVPVRYQDFGTGEDRWCLIKNVQFIQDHVEEQRKGQSEPSGVIVLMLRTTDGG